MGEEQVSRLQIILWNSILISKPAAWIFTDINPAAKQLVYIWIWMQKMEKHLKLWCQIRKVICLQLEDHTD